MPVPMTMVSDSLGVRLCDASGGVRFDFAWSKWRVWRPSQLSGCCVQQAR